MMFSTKLLLVFLASVFLQQISIECSETSDDKSFLAPYLNKRYKLATTDDKFDDVMKALGVSFVLRKLGNMAKPEMELKENNGEYTLSSESTFKNTYIKFRIGEEFEEVTPDGRLVRSIITQDKNKLIHVQKGDKTTVTTREFIPEEVKVVVQVDGITSVRTYTPL